MTDQLISSQPAYKITEETEPCIVFHPNSTSQDNIRNRLMHQIVSSVKGPVDCFAHKHVSGAIAFAGLREEETQIQSLIDILVPEFWQRVDSLFLEFVNEKGIYVNDHSPGNGGFNKKSHYHLKPMPFPLLIKSMK